MSEAALPYRLALAQSASRRAITAAYRRDEHDAVADLLPLASFSDVARARIRTQASGLVERVRRERSRASGVDALMNEFALSSDEGIALMCLAEALLRIPDDPTQDRLIRDKLAHGDWRAHLGASESLFVNAACWGLVLTGRIVRPEPTSGGLSAALSALLERLGEPVIRTATRVAMGFLGDQFVLGETIDSALARARTGEARGYRYSFDMLGEAAMTAEDAQRYLRAYEDAIRAIGVGSAGRGVYEGNGISVKLSALHPRYARAQHDRVVQELQPRLRSLMLLAQRYDIGLNIDAEEADRLELSLDLVEALALDPELEQWRGFGVVVQAFQKRCPATIDWLLDLAQRSGRRFMVRLVKGAYWDTEIKRAQVDGLPGYPVYTRKVHTDVSYLACARKLLDHPDRIYPQFATHNAATAAAVLELAGDRRDFEFQCLHGMGETLYDALVGGTRGLCCRIYAPVGTHETLLAYLVRRLLENGANSSFVNQIVDPGIPVERLLEDPAERSRDLGCTTHPKVPLPADLYPDRRNSRGVDLSSEIDLAHLEQAIQTAARERWLAAPSARDARDASDASDANARPVRSPADAAMIVGHVVEATEIDVERALDVARQANVWKRMPAAARAAVLDRAADRFEDNLARLVHLAVREAGRTIPNAIAEAREAVDFCRYYAEQARGEAPGSPLGTVACISPWNFPLSIFTGQVVAALAAGNAVVAKPAEQTPLIASEAVRVLLDSGVPREALQLLPGAGETVGARLVADARVDGVVFTGSTDVAQAIHRTLVLRGNVPLVAETGGQNAMIVDSSALPEQVVADVVASAFDSAGQRCSALRVLCLQEEIADRIIEMLRGAMRELRVGDPSALATDIGPIIDEDAQRGLLQYIASLEAGAKLLARATVTEDSRGHFVAPVAFEIESLGTLRREVFGPVLHVLRYSRDRLVDLVDAINATGYGLTLGVHSRVDSTIDFIVERARVGNTYVNRNMIGAVVGVQPFGGEGLSGTGPKAGGPLYLRALMRPAASRESLPCPMGRTHTDVLDAATAPVTLAVPGQHSAYVLQQFATHVDPVIAAIARDVIAQSLRWAPRELPGPTGERNTWRLEPRGLTVVLGDAHDSFEAYMGQALCAVAAGNPLVVVASDAGDAADRVLQLLRSHDTQVELAHDRDAAWSQRADLAAVCAGDTQTASRAATLVARRVGPRVPVVEPEGAPWRYPLWRVMTERTLCINTVASGGNARLLAEVD